MVPKPGEFTPYSVEAAVLCMFFSILLGVPAGYALARFTFRGATTYRLMILLTHWTPIDPILSMVTAILIVRGGYRVTRESAHILLEGTPAEFDTAAVERRIKAAVPTVAAVHHIHAWSLTDERPMMTLHVVLREGADPTVCLAGVQGLLRAQFNIVHATVQIESAPCGDDCGGAAR